MGDSLAAADGEFRGDADRHARHASVRAQQGGRHCLRVTRPPSTIRVRSTAGGAYRSRLCRTLGRSPRPRAAPPEAAAPLRQHGAAGRSVDARHVGLPGHRDHVLRRPVHGLPGLPVGGAIGIPGGQPPSRRHPRHAQHGDPDHQLVDHGARRARGANERPAEDAGDVDRHHDDVRAGLPRRSRRSSTPRSSATTSSPGPISGGRGCIRRARKCSTRSISA